MTSTTDDPTSPAEANQATGRTNLLSGIPIVVVEDDRATAKVYSKWLEVAEAKPIWCPSLGDFRERLEGPRGWISESATPPRIVVADLILPDGNGLDVLALWRKHFPQNPFIMVTAFASVENAVEAMRKGAFDFLRKPLQQEEMLIVLNRAMEHVRLLIENETLSTSVRVLSMAQTLSGINDKEQLLKTLGRLLHRELHAADCFVYFYNAARKHLECCLDFRNPGVPRRAPEIVAQQELAHLIAALPPPPETFGPLEIKETNSPRIHVNDASSTLVIELASSTSNAAYLVLQVPNLDRSGQRNNQYYSVIVQAQRTFQNLDLAAALSFVDELTGLYNQRFLDVALSNEIARAQRYGSPVAVLFIDLDKFKQVNDTYGHMVGSAILKAASKLLRSCMRDSDQLLRYGGDEFVGILPNTTGVGAGTVAERIRAAFDAHFFDVSEETNIREAVRIHVTTSIGVSCYPEVATDARQMVQLADNAMYESKRQGKNRITMASALEHGQHSSYRDGNLRKIPSGG